MDSPNDSFIQNTGNFTAKLAWSLWLENSIWKAVIKTVLNFKKKDSEDMHSNSLVYENHIYIVSGKTEKIEILSDKEWLLSKVIFIFSLFM